MNTDLATIDRTIPPASPASAASVPIDLLNAVLSGRNARTCRAYEADYRDFARYLGAPSPAAALESLIALDQGPANAVALGYRAHLVERGLAPATIARRLAALRSAVRLGRQLGRVGWTLQIEAPKVTPYRDTRGCGSEGWKRLLTLATREAEGSVKGARDLALVRLLRDLALRRAEVVALDVADLDPRQSSLLVLGKGRTGKQALTLPGPVRHALDDWLRARGDEPGPLFIRLDHAGRRRRLRLSGDGLHELIVRMGRRAGLSRPLRPHGLRHQGITAALDATGGNVRSVRKFSRHAKLDTLILYDDSRVDLAGDVARLISEEDISN